jgi:hypothetical protein
LTCWARRQLVVYKACTSLKLSLSESILNNTIWFHWLGQFDGMAVKHWNMHERLIIFRLVLTTVCCAGGWGHYPWLYASTMYCLSQMYISRCTSWFHYRLITDYVRE